MKDFLLDAETGDLKIENGDLVVGTSDQQHQRLLLLCDKGSFKEFPSTGVGASNFLEGEDPADFLREVRTQFTADGMTVRKIAFENNKLKIDARY
jgi:hypothetical protein